MTLTDLFPSLPIPRELDLPIPRNLVDSAARLLRGGRRPATGSRAAVFGLGMALGAGVTLLCAPQAGRELRRQLSNRIKGNDREDLEESSDTPRHASPEVWFASGDAQIARGDIS